MADRDDQDWFETLAGREPAAGAPAETIREAQAVRQAMLERRSRETGPEFDTESGLQRLLFRLRQERLLGKPQLRWPAVAGMALAASLALGIGLIVMQPGTLQEDPVFRGGPGAPQVLSVREPAKLGERMRDELAVLGLKPRLTQFGAVVTLEADWPADAEAAHKEFLSRHRLRPPPGTRLRIELQPPRN